LEEQNGQSLLIQGHRTMYTMTAVIFTITEGAHAQRLL
jgi:hypothetical protein